MGLFAVTEAVETMQKKNIRLEEGDLEFVLQFALATGDKELTEKLMEELADKEGEREVIFPKYQTLTGFRPDWVKKIEALLVALERYRMQGEKGIEELEQILAEYGMNLELEVEQEPEPKAPPKSVESSYFVTAVIKNGEDKAVVEFPTNGLCSVLGSIGIQKAPENVILGGEYEITFGKGNDGVANGLCELFQPGDSLALVNELARAVFHADFRVYSKVEERLQKRSFSSAEEMLKEVKKMSEDIKKKDAALGR